MAANMAHIGSAIEAGKHAAASALPGPGQQPEALWSRPGQLTWRPLLPRLPRAAACRFGEGGQVSGGAGATGAAVPGGQLQGGRAPSHALHSLTTRSPLPDVALGLRRASGTCHQRTAVGIVTCSLRKLLVSISAVTGSLGKAQEAACDQPAARCALHAG